MDVQTEEKDSAINDGDTVEVKPAELIDVKENVAEIIQEAPIPVLQVVV